MALIFRGPAKDRATLSLSVNRGERPVLSVMVPGHNYQLGQRIEELPRGALKASVVSGRRNK